MDFLNEQKITFNRLKNLISPPANNRGKLSQLGGRANQTVWEGVRKLRRREGDLMRFTVHYTALPFCRSFLHFRGKRRQSPTSILFSL